jgi:hypothetical protein
VPASHAALVIAFAMSVENADECFGDGLLDRAGSGGRALGSERDLDFDQSW